MLNAHGIGLPLHNGYVDASDLQKLQHKGLEHVCRQLKVTFGSARFPLVHFVMAMDEIRRRSSKHPSVAPQLACSILRAIFLYCQQHMEASTHECWWSRTSLLALTPRMGASNKRHRNLSKAYRRAALEETKATTEPINLRQYFACSALPAQSSGEIVTALQSKHQACTSERDYCLSYLGAAREHFAGVQILHLSIDGVQASTRHNEIFLATDPSTHKVAVPPFQAAFFRP